MKQDALSCIKIRRTYLALILVVSSVLSNHCASESSAAVAPQGNQSQRSLTPLQLEIEKLKQRLGSSEVEERREALMHLGALHRLEASRAALPALNDLSPLVRATAASSLSALPPEEAAEALIPLLGDKDEFVRQEAAYALGRTRRRNAISPLLERLRTDKSDGVRAAAAVALGAIGDESAVIGLAEILSRVSSKKQKAKPNEFVLRSTARALGQIGSRAGVPALIEALSNDSLGGDIRREAAKALGSIGDPSAISALRAVLTAPDPYLSGIAYDALRKIAANEARNIF
jgi:HEAT repeat protein